MRYTLVKKEFKENYDSYSLAQHEIELMFQCESEFVIKIIDIDMSNDYTVGQDYDIEMEINEL
jgi:hypothetical protein